MAGCWLEPSDVRLSPHRDLWLPHLLQCLGLLLRLTQDGNRSRGIVHLLRILRLVWLHCVGCGIPERI